MRNSKQRKAILRVLKNNYSHPTANWIYQEVQKELPHISKGTVYRNLKILKETGEILEIKTDGMERRYDARVKNHYHFRCESCGKLFDVDEPVNTKLDQKIAQKTGFKITHHFLEFRGICQECQKKETNPITGGNKNQKEV